MNTPERTPGPRRALRGAYAFLVSPKLAIGILIAVLACCVVGVTVLAPEDAWRLIFSTLWFNAVLVLLALSSAAAFFTRIWRRKMTLVQVGMIVFHLSFLALLGGVVVNDLLYFKGVLRLTEGETLPNGALESYDVVQHGRFFRFDRLRGETTLVRMHFGYELEGKKKGAAYEISVGEEGAETTDIIYITKNLSHGGTRYLVLKEGYSVTVVLRDARGEEIYGAHVPLQSLPRGEGAYFYTTGSAHGPDVFPFPAPPEKPLLMLQVQYEPDPDTAKERSGTVRFYVRREPKEGEHPLETQGEVPVGGTFDAGDFRLEAREIRYWVGMDVRYDPGLPVIFASLCFGLAGMVLTFVARVRQGPRKG